MIEKVFETLLWNSRFAVIIAVVMSLIMAFAVFYMAWVDAFYLVSHLGDYLLPDLIGEARQDFPTEAVTHVVEVIDGYLLATVLLIFVFRLIRAIY